MNENLAYQEEFRREEMIGGKLVAMGTPSVHHSMIVLNLSRILGNFFHGKACTPFGDNTKVYLSETERFIPDALVVCDAEKIRPDGIHGAPDLVVEVLSPSTADRDRRHKKDAYETYGVKEYWIISQADKTVEQYVLRDGRLKLKGVYSVYPDWMLADLTQQERTDIKTEFESSLFEDLVIQLEELFYRVP